MMKHLILVFVAALLFAGYAQARGGGNWHDGRGGGRGGNKQYYLGSHNFFLKPENQPQRWYCGPGLFPTEPCRAR